MEISQPYSKKQNSSVVSDEAVIKATGLTKSFDGQVILDGIDLTLHKGENIAVLGKSGTGKSVLLKSIIGLFPADKGELEILGRNMKEADNQEIAALRQKIGYLFQGGALYDSMTVRQNLRFPLERQRRKWTKNQIDEAIEEALSNVGLLNAINKTPAELSGGMQKRIALARTLILKPEIMLYYEPTTGLDPVTSKEISHLINEMRDKFNISSIIITHDISCVKITSDRIFIIKDKKLSAEGNYKELEHSDHEWVRSFFY